MEPLYPFLINTSAAFATSSLKTSHRQRRRKENYSRQTLAVSWCSRHIFSEDLNNEFCRAPSNDDTEWQLLWTASVDAFIISLTRMTDCVLVRTNALCAGCWMCVCVCRRVNCETEQAREKCERTLCTPWRWSKWLRRSLLIDKLTVTLRFTTSNYRYIVRYGF